MNDDANEPEMSEHVSDHDEELSDLLERCCAEVGLNYLMLADSVGVLPFSVGEDSQRIDIFITERGDAIVFHARVEGEFSSLDLQPGGLLARLLHRNSRSTYGHWAIEESDKGFVFALVYAIDRESLDGDLFERIVHRMLGEHRRFPEILSSGSPTDVQ